ncbi:MAG: ribosome biogenesis factor YjgA [Pseudomonadota bacterium]
MTQPHQPDSHTEEPPSKSARKRESVAFQEMARQLVSLSSAQLASLPADFVTSITDAQAITRGSARKRQIQYIGKLLRTNREGLPEQVSALLAQLDASSTAHNQHFHQLEQWRTQLIAGEATVFDDIVRACPEIDRQQLRMLTRRAQAEADSDQPQGTSYRSLFQFIKNAYPAS